MNVVEVAESKGSVGGGDAGGFGSCRSCESAYARAGESEIYPGGRFFILEEVRHKRVAMVGF